MTLSISVSGDDDLRRGLDGLPTTILDAAYKEMMISAHLIESGAKERAPYNTGKYRATIHASGDRDKMTAEVGTNDKRGPWLEHGTGVYGPKGQPYTISARNAKFLHWVDGQGGHHFARKVTIKGMRARPHMQPAFEAEKPTMMKNIEAAISKALEAL